MICFVKMGWGNRRLLVSPKNIGCSDYQGTVKRSVLQDQESRDEYTQHIGLVVSETTL